LVAITDEIRPTPRDGRRRAGQAFPADLPEKTREYPTENPLAEFTRAARRKDRHRWSYKIRE
jgi:hypothetical protein